MKFAAITTALGVLLSSLVLADNHEKAEAKSADVKLVITGNDAMQFDKKALEVTEGQVVELTFKNIGALPKEAMGHNVVILKAGTDLTQFALAASKPDNRPNDFLPQDDNKAKILAHTKLLGPGEDDTITFTAPAAGKYEYLCTFPGHFAIMRGVLTVKAK